MKTTYYLRSIEQFDWLMKHLRDSNKEINWKHLISDEQVRVFVSLLAKDGTPFIVENSNNQLTWGVAYDVKSDYIRVSNLMEGENKMERYLTIENKDLDKVELFHNNDYKGSVGELWDVNKAVIPMSLIYPKVNMTKAEKKDFDWLKGQNLDSLYRALDYIDEERSDYGTIPNLFEAIYANKTLSELDFIHAWVCPELIEVLPEKKWKVMVPNSHSSYYFKSRNGRLQSTYEQLEDHRVLFTEDELRLYGLDKNTFKKIEVQE